MLVQYLKMHNQQWIGATLAQLQRFWPVLTHLSQSSSAIAASSNDQYLSYIGLIALMHLCGYRV